MIEEHLIADLYSGLLLTRNCELVWLPLKVNEIIYWRYVLQGHPEREFRNLIWFIYCIMVPNTYKIQKYFWIFQSICNIYIYKT